MTRRVRKTLNIDAGKLKRVQRYLGAETETDAIERMLEAFDFERALAEVLESGKNAFQNYRSPLVQRSRSGK